MKRLLTALVFSVCGLSACGGGGSGPDGAVFVKNLLNETSDTTEPVAIEALELQFPERTSAFDSVFQ